MSIIRMVNIYFSVYMLFNIEGNEYMWYHKIYELKERRYNVRMVRYVHTNIIAKDCKKLISFYKKVFHCNSIGENRDLRGEWLDKMTGITDAHIVGEHLCLPGYGEDHPTLEIFSYDEMLPAGVPQINRCGLAHLAFEVEDVEETLKLLLQEGGSQIGDVVKADYEDGRKAVFVYATDCEGNIIELQNWQ